MFSLPKRIGTACQNFSKALELVGALDIHTPKSFPTTGTYVVIDWSIDLCHEWKSGMLHARRLFIREFGSFKYCGFKHLGMLDVWLEANVRQGCTRLQRRMAEELMFRVQCIDVIDVILTTLETCRLSLVTQPRQP